jgi:predicted Zn finger-like uncharacterized protein
MPVKTACPGCRTPYTLADKQRGKTVRCKQCKEAFTVSDTAEAAIRAEAVPAGPPRRRGETAPLPLPARPGPLPRRRPAARPEGPPKNNALLWILLASGGGLALLVGLIITVLLIANSSTEEQGPVVPHAPPFPGRGPNPMAPGANVPGMPNLPGRNPPPAVPNPQPAQAPGLIQASAMRFPIEPVDSQIQDLLFAPQARQVGCYYQDKAFRKRLGLYDVATGRPRGVIDLGNSAAAGHLDLSPDGTRVAQAENVPFKGNTITVWSAPDGKVLLEKWEPYPHQQPGIDPNRELLWFALLDRDRLLTVARNGQYDLWDLTQKRNLYSIPADMGRPRFLSYDYFARRPHNFALSMDRKTLALSNKNGYDLIDTATGRLLRSTQGLEFKGRVGNEWSVAFSPDGNQLAAKLNVHEVGRRQHGYVVVWEVATGQQKALWPVSETDLNANGPLLWWGTGHLILCDSIRTEGRVFSLADGKYRRICQRSGFGKVAGSSPDGRLWYATSLVGLQRADVSAVEAPEGLLRAALPQGPQLPRWQLRPEGVAAARGVR